MLIRVACIIPVFLLLACASPVQRAKQQTTVAAIHAGEPVAGNSQSLEAWWPVRFADRNKCLIQGHEEGSEAFAQCVKMTVDQQSKPHRCTYCRSVD
jgi:hypothetical protein